jgi:hypothetical protein
MLFLVLQFPIADVRSFISANTYKLARPSWPIAQVKKEFVRYFGIVDRRKKGGLKNWTGEGVYSVAKNAFRFPSLESQTWYEDDVLMARAICAFRRLFSNGEALIRIETGFTISGDYWWRTLTEDWFIRIIDNLLGLKTLVRSPNGDLEMCDLQDANRYLAPLYMNASTQWSHHGIHVYKNWWVMPCEPVLVVEYNNMMVSNWLPKNRQVLDTIAESEIEISHFWFYRNGQGIRVWLLGYETSGPWECNIARRLRLNLLRLHSELECLKQILRLILQNKLVIEVPSKSSDLFQAYLNRSIRILSQCKGYGFPQDEILKTVLGYEEIINPDQKITLMSQLEKMRLNIRKKLDNFTSKSKVIAQPAIVIEHIGKKINIKNTTTYKIDEVVMGDKFKDITDSTIINRSHVEKSFNKVNEKYDEETANAILRVAKEIERSDNKDAGALFDGFNQELAKSEPNKTVLKTIWDGILTHLPSITGMVDVISKITRLFI